MEKDWALRYNVPDMSKTIKVVGARENNLKNINLEIPRDKLVVFTGLSGSGKSSLAFDTIYAEGQRRYVESLSSYARQFLGVMEKPDVDYIEGLSPAISIDQKSASRNPRSTVATITEIYDYLRLLFARIGVAHCPVCHKEVSKRTTNDILEEILKLPNSSRLILLAPIIKAKKGEFIHIPEQFIKQGFARVRVDGVIYSLVEFPELDKNYQHTIEIVVDRLVLDESVRGRLAQSLEQALTLGQGVVEVLDDDSQNIISYSQNYACLDHPEQVIPPLEPRLFSFNAPQGACPVCTGLGHRLEIDPELVLNKNLTIMEGAIRPYNRFTSDAWYIKRLQGVAEHFGFSLRVPTRDLRSEDIQKILYGTGAQKYKIKLNTGQDFQATYEGVIPNLERRYRETDSEFFRRDVERFMRKIECGSCHGARLKEVVLAVTIHELNILDIGGLDIDNALDLFTNQLKLTERENLIAEQVVKEIITRLTFLKNVGLGYIELNRSAQTLSGGEAQRIRLATQIGSGLQGVLYVLDEPSIGLHQRDNQKLIDTLKHLRDSGNSVIVVEHDTETITQADFVVDIGPGAGSMGGEVVAVGTPAEIKENSASITGRYLSGVDSIATPKKRRPLIKGKWLTVIGAKENNLKNINVSFPLGVMTVVSGVSGSGKSTLVNDILAEELLAKLHQAQTVSGRHDRIEGIEHLNKVIVIDQSPIGRTPRSNPATYTGIFTPIRELFASLPEANVKGYKAGRFSFNVAGGRCETCRGDGVIKIEMHFLPDVYVTCETCHGRRYNQEALEIKYKGATISDILAMTVDQAFDFFINVPGVANKLQTLKEVGLGYIELGQSATTFSGGEAQRIKLATELARRSTGKTLYVLDEPTTGLHSDDIKRLLKILNQLVDAGNTVIVIEHNLDVIKSADYIIDMGPEGGREGGLVVAEGRPEEVAKQSQSFTGQYLKKYFNL